MEFTSKRPRIRQHRQFVDNTHVIIEAKPVFVEETFKVFRTMGKASGLYVKEMNVKAVFVADTLVPPKLRSLPFSWESKGNLSKLLGIFIKQEISM